MLSRLPGFVEVWGTILKLPKEALDTWGAMESLCWLCSADRTDIE